MEEYVDINKLSIKPINKDVAKKMIIKHANPIKNITYIQSNSNFPARNQKNKILL